MATNLVTATQLLDKLEAVEIAFGIALSNVRGLRKALQEAMRAATELPELQRQYVSLQAQLDATKVELAQLEGDGA